MAIRPQFNFKRMFINEFTTHGGTLARDYRLERYDFIERAPETYQAFQKHIHSQLQLYKSITVVTLTELNGSERIIGDAYLENVLKYNSKDVTFVVFDFHEYCRGMKFENVSILTDWLKDIIKNMRYCWIDNTGQILEQRGVFRISCVDCLDRTNVVMTAIARIVLESQCRKLGLLAPEVPLPDNCRKIFQQLWANNGDAISKQYAGTVALKGDFTRTGERKMAGVMKDGINSANRYYLRFKDTYRQAAIDLTHGISVSEDVLEGKIHEDDIKEMVDKEENTKQLIEDCKMMLILEPEECLGAWSLINADPSSGETDNQDVDIVVLLSHKSVYVVWYDDEEEQVIQYQKIGLEDIEKIEIGAEPSLFKSKTVVMRIYYRHHGNDGFFHTFKASGTRMFNNVIIPVKTVEDAKDQLNVISEAFKAAQNLMRRKLLVEGQRKKTQPHLDLKNISQQLQVGALSQIKLPRNVSNIDFSAEKPGSLFISPSHTKNTLSPNPKSPSSSQSTMNPKDQKLSPSTNQKQLSPFGETSKAATFYIADDDANSVVDHKFVIPNDHSIKVSRSDIRCLCTDKEKCPHKKKFQTHGSDLWTGSNTWNLDLKLTVNSEMNFKQYHGKSHETDMILPHVSKSTRMIQSHTSMRPSLSDTALAVSHSNLAKDISSISMRRSDTKLNQELNEKLKMQIPNFLESSQMPRKCHRAYEILKRRMHQQLGESVCSSMIIFI